MPCHLAVGSENAYLLGDRLPGFNQPCQRRLGTGSVLEVYGGPGRAQIQRLAQVQPVQGVHALRPGPLAGANVEVPATEAGQGLGLPQTCLGGEEPLG